MKVNSGNDQQALVMASQTALAGTASATSATSLTSTGFVASAYIGQMVLAGSTAANFVYGVIVSNTTTVLTVDRWYNPASLGGAAGSTPSSTAPFIILPGGAPAFYTALTANATGPAAGDTTLTAEITTAGGGLIRKISVYAHTGGANSYTLTTVYTANGSDSLPVTIAKAGVFNSISSGLMVFETLLSATATMTAVSDQLTTTHTVTT